jgi:hypothetical protein
MAMLISVQNRRDGKQISGRCCGVLTNDRLKLVDCEVSVHIHRFVERGHNLA